MAKAAGPRKLSFTSRTVQSDTQAPHIMQFITPTRCTMSSLGARYSPSGTSPSGIKYGSTALNLSQKGLKSATRSEITGIFPTGSTNILLFFSTTESFVLHTSFACPFTLIAHDPHIDALQAHLRDKVPSISSRILINASKTVNQSSTSTS